MSSLATAAAIIGVVSVFQYGSQWFLGHRIARADRPLLSFRRGMVVGSFISLLILGVSFALLDVQLATSIFEFVDTPLDGTWVGSVIWVAVYGAASLMVLLSGLLGLFPHYRDARGVDIGYRRFIGEAILVLVVLWVVTVIATVLAHANQYATWGWIPVLMGAVGVVMWVASPWLIRTLGPTRPPTDAERQRLQPLLDATELTIEGIWILETTDAKNAFAGVRGLARLRTLFLSDYLLANSDDVHLRTLLVSKAGRVRHRYVEYKFAFAVGVLGVIVAPLELGPVVASASGFALSSAWTVLWVTGLVLLGMLYWRIWSLTYRIDDYVARHTGAEALIATLEHLADLQDMPVDSKGLPNYLALRPPLSRRLDRLRQKESQPAEN